MQRDAETFRRYLRSEGYYEPTVVIRIEEGEDEYRAIFEIAAGPQYRVEHVRIERVDGAPDPDAAMPDPSAFGLAEGVPARAQLVLDAENEITAWYNNRGYPFARVTERRTVVDRATKMMDVRFMADTGARFNFGELQISGLDKVDRRVLELETPWRRGDLFEEQLLSLYRKRLYDTGLFSVVRTEAERPPDGETETPISVDLIERDHRTIELGAEYSTDEGFGGVIGWNHRNLWGQGHHFSAELRLGQTRQEVEAILTLERFRRRGQRLRFGVLGGRLDPDAFTSNRLTVGALIERDFTESLTGSSGIGLRYSRVEQLGEFDRYQYVLFPVELIWDRSNDALDPTRGFRLSGIVESFVDPLGDSSAFIKARLGARYYLPMDADERWVAAFRVVIGSILGEDRDGIPADERFYAGGGGSIRGYAFQSVGPLFGGEPIGGASLFESSVELRFRITESVGLVAFADGGSAFESNVPNFDEEILVGVGGGLRYFSPIGPFRLDIGLPLDQRADIDRSFQVYLSIGQAF
jgi:translocation and assembly module TamA